MSANNVGATKADPNTNGNMSLGTETGSVPTKSNGSATTNGGVKAVEKTGEENKESKISGAELKKRAKAEKAARRAQVKQEKQPPRKGGTEEVPKQSTTGMGNKEISKPNKNGILAAPAAPISKGQHKRTGSTSVHAQKSQLPGPRPPQPSLIQAVTPKESRKVALFGHLYGQPRRTTLTGAGKDVHPAVLALGLQMSNYVVCGSNARCIATLLVFKRVSSWK